MKLEQTLKLQRVTSKAYKKLKCSYMFVLAFFDDGGMGIATPGYNPNADTDDQSWQLTICLLQYAQYLHNMTSDRGFDLKMHWTDGTVEDVPRLRGDAGPGPK